MNVTSSDELQKMMLVERPLKYVHLKYLVLGTFVPIYHLNDGFEIKTLSQISIKEQLLFQKMKSRNQQLNLMLVDSLFPVMLAELASKVLIDGAMTIENYVKSGCSVHGEYLMSHKLQQFVHLLLYSEVAVHEAFTGNLDYEKVYYRKKNAEIEYYSVYDQKELIESVYKTAILEVDLNTSYQCGKEAFIELKVRLD